MPRCRNCDAQISKNDDVCPECDTPVRPMKKKSGNNTLMILLIVGGSLMAGMCVIVPILIALLLPAVQQARTAARRAQSRNNLKQIGLALHTHQDATRSFPAGGTFTATGEGLHGWMTPLLPYLDQPNLLAQIDMQSPWNSPRNQPAFKNTLAVFQNPNTEPAFSPEGYALANYAGNSLALPKDKGLKLEDFTDGLSNTILAGEVVDAPLPWGSPDNVRDPALGLSGPGAFGCPASNVCQILLGDGSVRSINQDIAPQTLKALGTPQGAEVLGEY